MSARIRLLGCLALLPALLSAQDAEARRELAAWRDSLDQVSDVVLLTEIHQRVLQRADSSRGDPMAELRLGIAALRLADLTDDTRLIRQAILAFNGVTEDHPDWPLPWGWLAEAELAEARSGTVGFGLRQLLGLDPEAEIIRYFFRGSGPDTTITDGFIRLGDRALASRTRVDGDVALRTLRLVPHGVVRTDAKFALVRARIEREVGEKDSAVAVIERIAAIHRDDPLVLRAQSQMRFVVGRPDGAAPWYRALELADERALERIVSDLAMVVPDSTMRKLRAARGRDRPGIMRAFWQSQDPDGLPTEDDRLAEHYRRLEFARHNYVRQSFERDNQWYELDTLGTRHFDSRGEIMLRHGSPRIRTSIGNFGAPEVTVTLGIIGMPPNESWGYDDRTGATRYYHFVRPEKEADYRSVESILDILAYTEQFKRFRPDAARVVPGDTTHRTMLIHGGELVSVIAQELLISRQEMNPIFTEMLDQGFARADSMQRLEREIGRENLRREYTYELGFELPLDAAIEILAVGSDRAGPVVQVAFSISAGELTPVRMTRGVVYPIRMRVAVRDLDGTVVARVDTVRSFVSSSRLDGSQQLVGQLPIRVPPGSYQVRASVEADRRGRLSPVTRVEVVGGGDRLVLSDVSIGARSVPITWRSTNADTAWANPRGTYRSGEELQLYFEVGGLDRGTEYRTQIAVDRGRSAEGCSVLGNAFTLAFDAEHPGGIAREQRAVSIDRLRPGDYTLAVTVSTESGQRATRCRQFTVIR